MLFRRSCNFFIALILTFLITSPVWAGERETLPRPSELLRRSVDLGCQSIVIVEWRGSRQYRSGQSPEAVQMITDLCKMAILRYPEFLLTKNYNYNPTLVKLAISLLPANVLLGGRGPRALNDRNRFGSITGPNDSWGIYQPSTLSVFLRNDVVQPSNTTSVHNHWARTFLHEMAHVMNDQWRVEELNFPNNYIKDEKTAEAWVAWLGYGTSADSSEEDAAEKR